MDNTDDTMNSAAAAAAAAGSSMSPAYEEFTDEDDEVGDDTVGDGTKTKKSSNKKTQSSKGKKRQRNDSTSSSDSSGSSSDSDDSSSGSDSDERPPPKKSKKKSSATTTKKKKQAQQQKGGSSDTTDDPINTLVEMAIKSQKKQFKNQMINSVKTDVLSALQKRLNNASTPPSGDTTAASSRTDKSLDEDGKTASKTLPKEYVKRIKQAYKEHEEGYDDSPKFNTKQHRKSINKLYGTIDQLNGVELLRIPYIDKEMGLHDFITKHGLDRKVKKLDKKTLSASPDKTIPEAEYAALRDAYSSCMLYKYFFTRLLPYVTVPYIQ